MESLAFRVCDARNKILQRYRKYEGREGVGGGRVYTRHTVNENAFFIVPPIQMPKRNRQV